ncbi:MAG: DUF4115 domain-containing protein [Clostridia bacterium]|nr:DUF4115 domain-containing protein [Clostridia bacterium]
MGIIGDTLRKAREEKGLTLQQVETETNMRWKYLEALEKEEYDVIPGQTYVKGFLRNYSAFLGLDCDYMLDLYRQHLEEVEKAKALEERMNERRNKREQKNKQNSQVDSTSGKGAYWIAALSLVLVLGGGFYAFNVMDKPTGIDGPNPSTAQVSNPQEKPSETSQQEVYDAGSTVTSETYGGQASATTGNQVYQQEPAGNTSDTGQNPAQEGVNLTLNFTERTTWLKVKVDEKVVFEGFAGPGGTRTFQARDKIWLRAGDAGAVEVIENNQNKGKLGGPGEPKTMEFLKP